MVSRPTVQPNSFALSTLQVGFPPAVPWYVEIGGTELWLGSPGASNYLMYEPGQANRPLRFPLPVFPMTPPGTMQLSYQAASLLVTAIGSGTCSSLWSASPAIFLSY